MARCLYCGKTLWLRFSSRGSEFCAEEHRRQYDELVLARLQADDAEKAVPAEHPAAPQEPEAVIQTGTGAVEIPAEPVPVAAGFRQTRSAVLLAQKTRSRQPIAFHQETIAWRLARETRPCAGPAAAPPTPLPVSPSAGMLQLRTEVEWNLSRVTLDGGIETPSACPRPVANLREVRFTGESGCLGNSSVRAGGRWTWRSILPVHAVFVIEPVLWETPHPARLIRLRIASHPKAPAHPRPPAWGYTSPAIPRMDFTISPALPAADPHPLGALPQKNRNRNSSLGHCSIWSHAALALSARRCAFSAGVLPAQLHPALSLPRDNRARIPDCAVSIAIAPILLPRLKAHPPALPAPRREDGAFPLEPKPPAAPLTLFRWLRSRWNAGSRLARVAILLLPLLGAGVHLASRIPRALPSLRWQHPALARQIESTLRQRALIEVADDFRSGLSGWDGGPEWSERWSYDPAGFVHPGRLALLTASRPLADYRFEFLGLVEKKGLGWVFRASDLRNYYAIKIVIARPGPLPRAVLVRSVVAGGVVVQSLQLPLPMSIRNGKFYRIQTSAYQDRFVTLIDGRVVDTFFDRRHRAGGVGLFSEPGEDARVMGLRVADRDDFLGHLCAYFLRHSADSSSEATRSTSRIESGGTERK